MCGLYAEFLIPLVGGYPHHRVQDLGVGHLRCDGPFPDQVVKLLLLGGSFNLGVLDKGGTDRLVSLLGPFSLGLELAGLLVFRSEMLRDVFLRSAEGERGQIGGICSHVGD